MAISVRKGTDAVLHALVASYNALRGALATAATKFHADVTSRASSGDFTSPAAAALAISAAAASDLATSLTLVNQLKAYFNIHFADAVAHAAADATNAIATADATDLATAITLVNAIKAKYNAHLSQGGVHYTNDATNTTTAVNATDQASVNTLANELKADFNAHIAGAPAGSSIVLVDP